jgi:hypothetical protein
MRDELFITQQGTQQRYEKGVYGVVFIGRRAVRPLYSLSGGVRHRYRLKWPHFMPDSPRLPAYSRHGFSDLRWLFTPLGPDIRTCHWQFIPFNPFLPSGTGYWECIRTK